MARYNYTGYAYLHYHNKAVLAFIDVDSHSTLQVWNVNALYENPVYRGRLCDHPACEIKPTRDTALVCYL